MSSTDIPQHPPILRLPFDVLSIILGIVVSFKLFDIEKPFDAPDSPEKNEDVRATAEKAIAKKRDRRRYYYPLLDIRSTCRTFRQIADQLPFWYADDFDIADPCPYFPFASRSFLETLLADQHLQACLSRKKAWRFREPHDLEIVCEKIPQFSKNVQSVRLTSRGYYRRFDRLGEGGEEWGAFLEVPTRPLRSSKLNITFPNLTSLDVLSRDHIHLDKLPRNLRVLHVLAPFAKCNCKNSLPNLEDLQYTPYSDEVLDFTRLLPYNSKSTLTRFQAALLDYPTSPTYIKDMKYLVANFVHIRDLAIHPMTAEMCQVLASSGLRLKSFSTHSDSEVPEHQIHASSLFHNLLASSVLREVKAFRYEGTGPTQFGPETRTLYEPSIHLITRLPDLETLYLGYPLHEDWFESLRASSNLRKIVWDYSDFPTDEVRFHFDFEDSRLTEALQAALTTDLNPAPYVDVHSRNRYEGLGPGMGQYIEEERRKLRVARGLPIEEEEKDSEEEEEDEDEAV